MDGTGESYIVRIYRRRGRSDSILVGTVQEAGVAGKWGFTNFEELKEIICRPGRRSAKREPGTSRGKGRRPSSPFSEHPGRTRKAGT